VTDLSQEAKFIKDVCLDAGKIMMGFFRNITTWETKIGRGDIVTEADHAVEDMVLARLRETFPGHNLLTEERGWVRADESLPTWVLDPVDGTRNFAIGEPTFAISLAYLVDKQPLLGVVYAPYHKDLYFAQKDGGAWLNGNRLSVSAQPDLGDSIASVSWSPIRDDIGLFLRTMERMSEHTSYFRRIGSAAIVMAHIASGRWDAYIQGGIKPWDIAAGMLLVEEAGGVVSTFEGGKIDLFSEAFDLLAANPSIHRLLVDQIMAADV